MIPSGLQIEYLRTNTRYPGGLYWGSIRSPYCTKKESFYFPEDPGATRVTVYYILRIEFNNTFLENTSKYQDKLGHRFKPEKYRRVVNCFIVNEK